jgi:predicted metal-binding protein
MGDPIRLGIIICDRYRSCGGSRCLRALHNREDAFGRYKGRDVELVGVATCMGCPGGNVEYVPQEMKNNGAEVIHLATGLIVGYPSCPRISNFSRSIKEKYGGCRCWYAPNPPEILPDTPETRLVRFSSKERDDRANAHG